MLLRFQVANHASIRDEQEITFVAGDDRPQRAQRPVPGTRLAAVPVAAVYGANASGKSNVVSALAWMRRAVLDSFRHWDPAGGVPRRPFRLRQDPGAHPSTYELDFAVDGVRYEFGFTVDDAGIREEWLACFPEGKRRKLYTRTGPGPDSLTFGRSLAGRRKTISELLRSNSLYLSVAAAQNHELLGRLHRWFRDDLRTASDQDYRARLTYTVGLLRSGDERSRDALVNLLRFSDLGVTRLEFHEPDERLLDETKRIQAALNDAGVPFRLDAPEHDVRVRHRTEGGTFTLELDEESSGTRTWIGMLGPVLLALGSGGALVVDELDARLHPYLADALVGMFQSPDVNRKGAQLLFTTHEASLLGNNARTQLFRDQVWFTEKDPDTLGTRLFPITDFHVRDSPDAKDNLEKRYLSGRYGALPFLDDELLRRMADDIASGGVSGAGQAVEAGRPKAAGAAQGPRLLRG
ncbi:AAA family ATPase [Streptomyces hoynatensis]|uniref:ATP-binding protein n=1 Tax=Streptomyces hoynatensis TaxID=1141874 RepID=A0A3A9Z143_9ACTN|nr:ATP-binding protein [Streptomyces hoynatensis]RKN41895.1 ATP-binding protein [Streptomyces hoynatensis]